MSINYVVNGSSKTTIFSSNDVDDAWFMDDENYIGVENQLSSIVQTQGGSFNTLVPSPYKRFVARSNLLRQKIIKQIKKIRRSQNFAAVYYFVRQKCSQANETLQFVDACIENQRLIKIYLAQKFFRQCEFADS